MQILLDENLGIDLLVVVSELLWILAKTSFMSSILS